MKTGLLVMILSALVFCGCGKSSSAPRKSELRERMIRKYSKIIPREQVLALLGEGNSEEVSRAIFNLNRSGYSDEFQSDLDTLRAAKD